MSQLVECQRCARAGVLKQYIDFLKVGKNPTTGRDTYIIYDHGTKDLHVNKKACTYGCNTIIVWDTEANRYKDFEGGLFHENPCEGVERYQEMAARQYGFIDAKRRSEMIAERPPVQQTTTTTTATATTIDPVGTQINPPIEKEQKVEPPLNPLAAELARGSSSDLFKTINYMWAMIKEIDRKVDAIQTMREENKDFAESVVASFNSIDEVLAKILTLVDPEQFKKGSDLLKEDERSVPTEQELRDIFQDNDQH